MFLSLAFFSISSSNAQILPNPGNTKNKIYFWHDANGNRTKKQINTIDCQMFEWPPNEPEPVLGPSRSLTDTTKISFNSENYGIVLFPNPASDLVNITINTNLTLEGASIFVFDLKGTKVFTKENIKNESAESISIANLPIGIYLIKLRLNNHQEIVWKVEKMNF